MTPIEYLKTITLPQAIIVLGLIAGGVAIAYRLPEDTLVEAVSALVALGVGGTLLTSRRKTPAEPAPPRAIPDPGPPPPRPRRLPRDGSADPVALVAWGVFALGVILALARAGVLR